MLPPLRPGQLPTCGLGAIPLFVSAAVLMKYCYCPERVKSRSRMLCMLGQGALVAALLAAALSMLSVGCCCAHSTWSSSYDSKSQPVGFSLCRPHGCTCCHSMHSVLTCCVPSTTQALSLSLSPHHCCCRVGVIGGIRGTLIGAGGA